MPVTQYNKLSHTKKSKTPLKYSLKSKLRFQSVNLIDPQSIPTPDDTSDYPIHEAVEKLEAKRQVAGAEYLEDIPAVEGELYAAIVKAPYAPATFDPVTDVDTTQGSLQTEGLSWMSSTSC